MSFVLTNNSRVARGAFGNDVNDRVNASEQPAARQCSPRLEAVSRSNGSLWRLLPILPARGSCRGTLWLGRGWLPGAFPVSASPVSRTSGSTKHPDHRRSLPSLEPASLLATDHGDERDRQSDPAEQGDCKEIV